MKVGETFMAGESQSARINWSRIVGSAANGAKSIFEPIMPNTVSTISNTSTAIKDLRDSNRALRSNNQKQLNNMKNSADNKKSQGLFKSAFDDIKDGSYSLDNINNDLFDDYESSTAEAFQMPTGDDVADMSSEEILLIGNKGVAQSVIQSSSAQIRGMQQLSKSLINSNVKTTQALGLSINNTLQYGFSSLNATLTAQNRKLDSINSSLHSMIEFNNKNALTFYTKSIDMMAGMGKMMDNLEKSMNPPARNKGRRFDVSNGFNIKEYAKYIKEGIQESLIGASATAIKGGAKGGGGILQSLIPAMIKEPLEKFDKSLTRYMDEALTRLSETFDSTLGQMLGVGDILGNKRGKINGTDLGKYIKEATPWNGVAQKALTEVIPEYLASIDATLRKSEKMYYDYNKGHFKSESSIRKDMENEYFDTFAMYLKESMEKLTEVAKATGRNDTDQLMSRIQGYIDDSITGKTSATQTRRNMRNDMRDFGIDQTGIREFIVEFTSGLEESISKINDLYHEIDSTQHIYRNINNKKGSEFTKTLRNSQTSRGGRSDRYTSFSFYQDNGYGNNARDVISKLQRKAGIQMDLSGDKELQDEIDFLILGKASEDVLIAKITAYAANKSIKEKINGNGRIARVRNRIDTATTNTANRLNNATNRVLNDMFDPLYMEEFDNIELDTAGGRSQLKGRAIDQVQRSRQRVRNAAIARQFKNKRYRNVGTASTRFSKRGSGNNVDSKEQRDIDQITAMNSRGYDKVMEQSEVENNRDMRTINQIGEDYMQAPMADSVESSIIQSNNSVKVFMGTMLHQFQGFTSRLFGKEGLFHKIWDSDARKEFTNKLKEMLFTGEDAVFKDQYEAAKKGIKDFGGRVKEEGGKGYDFLYTNTMKYLYGDDYEKNEKFTNNKMLSQTLNRKWRAEQKKNKELLLGTEGKGIEEEGSEKSIQAPIEEAVENIKETTTKLQEHIKATAEVMVGSLDEDPQSKAKAYKQEFASSMKKNMPKALVAAGAGAAIGMANSSFSLLGSMFLPGGPISGAIVGGGLSILSQTEAFQTFMFGQRDKNTNEREGGLISKELREKFKKMTPAIVGGAVLSGVKSVITGALGFNSGLGILGMQILPGGIIGGALLGAGFSMLKNSETFKETLFGKKDENGKRSGTVISDSFNKLKGAFSKAIPGLKKAGAGLGVGALSGAVLANAGYIPAMLSLGGPVGMGIVGLGVGIASSTKSFNEWMFGTDKVDKDGNVIGKNKDGVLSRVQNLLMVNVIRPMADTFQSKMLDLVDWTKEKITFPFRKAFGPILDSLLTIKDNITDIVTNSFNTIGEGIQSIITKAMKSLFSPITKIVGKVGSAAISAATTGIQMGLAPVSFGLQAASVLTSGTRRKEYMDFYKNYYAHGNINEALNEKWEADAAAGNKRGFLGRTADRFLAYTGNGDIADAARAGWNEQMTAEGKNRLNWRNVHREQIDLKKNRAKRKDDEKMWKKVNKYGSMIANKDLEGREVELTDWQFKKYRDRFKKLGIDEQYLQNSDDMMDLIYRSGQFRKRMDPNSKAKSGDNGIHVEETPEQKAAREKTEQYQSHVQAILDRVAARMGIAAKDVIDEKRIESADKEWTKEHKKFKDRVKKSKVGKGMIDLKDAELRDFNLNEVDEDMLNSYRWSKYYASKDFKGFMRSRGVTQKSQFKLNPEEDAEGNDTVEAWTGGAESTFRKPKGIKGLFSRFRNRKKKKSTQTETGSGAATSAASEENTGNQYSDEVYAAMGILPPASNGGVVDQQKTTNNKLTELIDKVKELLHVNQEQKELINVQTQISTEGTIDDDEIAKKKGKNFASNLLNKFNPFNKIKSFFSNKKNEEELEKVRGGTSAISKTEKEKAKGEQKEEKKSIFSIIWDKIKGLGALIGGSSIGGLVLKGIKVAGTAGLLGTLGLTVAELIKPGTAKMVGEKINSFTEYITSDDFSLKTAITDVKNKIVEFGGMLLGKATEILGPVGEFITDTVFPAVTGAGKWLLENVPKYLGTAANWVADHAVEIGNAFSTVIESVGPPLIKAAVTIVPSIVKSIGKVIIDALKDFLPGFLRGDDPDKSDLTEEEAEYDLKENGKYTSESLVGTANTRQEAESLAKSSGIENPIYEEDENGGYRVYERIQTRNDQAVDENGNGVNVTNGALLGGLINYGTAVASGNQATIGGTKAVLKYGGKALSGIGGFIKGVPLLSSVPGVKLLGTTLQGTGNVASGSVSVAEKASGVASSIKGFFGNVASKLSGTKAVETVANSTDDAVEVVEKMAQYGDDVYDAMGIVSEATTTEGSQGIIKAGVERMIKAAEDLAANPTLQKVFSKFGLAVEKISGLVTWFTDKFKALLSLPKTVANKLASMITEALSNFGISVTTEAMTAGILAVMKASAGGIVGAIDAPNLFNVRAEDCTVGMRFTSAVLQALLSISFGSLVEALLAIAQVISGKNLKRELAEFLYKLFNGNSEEAIATLEQSQEKINIERELYNAINDTNLDEENYNQLRNKTLSSKAIDAGKSIANSITGLFGKEFFKIETSTKDTSEAAYKDLVESGRYTVQELQSMSAEELKEVVKAAGYGGNGVVLSNNPYAQGNPKWSNMPIGYLPNGTIATMGQAGCGPTAMAAVANTVAARNATGYGGISPADMGAYAASNGYISQGGANVGLFTQGANNLGLTSTQLSNSGQLRQNLVAGNPTILTGKSSSSNDPYTNSGHIVMADGIQGDTISVLDPITGKHKGYNINDVSQNTENGWAYSAGYGADANSIMSTVNTMKSTPLPTSSSTSVSSATSNLTNITNQMKNTPIPTSTSVITPEAQTIMNTVNTMKTTTIPTSTTTKAATTASDAVSIKDRENGIIDYNALNKGHHTGSSTGIDVINMSYNYNYFTKNDTWYSKNYTRQLNYLKLGSVSKNTRSGKVLANSYPKLAWILCTQYFPIGGGTYGSIKIVPQYENDTTKDYKDISTDLNKDKVAQIYAAAIISENNKGNAFVTAPLSDAERYLAFCNGCRVMYGLDQTIQYIYNGNWSQMMNTAKEDDYKNLVAQNAAIGTDVASAIVTAEDSTNGTTGSGGITDAETLRQIASTKGIFGKLALLGKVAQAQISALKNGTSFWEEFSAITTSYTGGTSSSGTGSTVGGTTTSNTSGAVLNSASTSLQNAISNPANIQEELLGKTIEQIYRGESGGKYNLVHIDSNNKPSIGPWQANAEKATNLLRQLQNAQGISSELRTKFGNYAGTVNSTNFPSSSQEDLANALGNEEYADAIRKVIDTAAMEDQNKYFRQSYSPWYDNGTLKDLRTIPMLADIGNTGPGNITSSKKNTSFISNWSPTTKEKELDAAYNTLISPSVYYKQSKYASGYLSRIKTTYDNMKNYTFKRAVEPGQLSQYFAAGTNPMGFGPDDTNTTDTTATTDTTTTSDDTTELNASNRFSFYKQGLTSIAQIYGTSIAKQLGVDPSELGFSFGSSDSSSGTSGVDAISGADASVSSGSTSALLSSVSGGGTRDGSVLGAKYSMSDDVLTSISGSDRDRYVAAALSQVGYNEKVNESNIKSFTANVGKNNYTKYGREIGGMNGPDALWCNFFTSWAGKAAGIPSSIVYRGGHCATTMNQYKNMGAFHASGSGYTPQPGDLIFFKNSRNNSATNHIGIVTGCDGSTVTTVEGNTSESAGIEGNGGIVTTKSYSISDSGIVGYGTPPWTGENKTVDPRTLLSLGYGNLAMNALTNNKLNLDASTLTKLSSAKSNPLSSLNSRSGAKLNYAMSNDVLTKLGGTDRERFVTAAISQIGYTEKNNEDDLKSFKAGAGDQNYTKYAREIGGWNGPDALWCNYFTSWAGKAAGIPENIVFPNAACVNTMKYYQENGLFHTPEDYTPDGGDLIFFKTSRNNSATNHIGIVTGTNGNQVNTVEGNTEPDNGSGDVESNGGAVYAKSYDFDNERIVGYAKPAWTNEVKTVDPQELLSLGYGNLTRRNNRNRVDSLFTQEKSRDSMLGRDFSVTPEEFKALGFGPGMQVDAGFDMSTTDGKLDQIAGLISEWYTDSKKNAASSADTTTVVVDNSKTSNVTANGTNSETSLNKQKYRDSLVQNHIVFASKKNVRNNM